MHAVVSFALSGVDYKHLNNGKKIAGARACGPLWIDAPAEK